MTTTKARKDESTKGTAQETPAKKDPAKKDDNLTQRWLDAKSTARLAKDKGVPVFRYDDDVIGFGVKLSPGGSRVYFYEYRFAGRTRRMTFAKVGDMTLDEARERARSLAGLVADGGDPATEEKRAGEVPTFADFAERFMAEHIRPRRKSGTVDSYERILKLHLVPALGSLQLTQVTPEIAVRLHNRLAKPRPVKVKRERVVRRKGEEPTKEVVTVTVERGGKYQANRAMALLSAIYNRAEAWAVVPRGTNPVPGIERFEEKGRERLLSAEELAALGTALRKAEKTEPRVALDLIRLLILSGARRDEIRTLKWSEVDLTGATLRLADSKTGAKVIHLPAPAVEVLQRQPRVKDKDVECEFVFPAMAKKKDQPRGHFVGIARVWERIREVAGLADVRIHDLRHCFASTGVIGGESLLIVGKLLGHKHAMTTQRYAHLSADPVKQAGERIAATIQSALSGKPAAEVASIEPRKK